jgi:hypothetical protein
MMRKYIIIEIFLIFSFLFLLFLENLIFYFYSPEFKNINTADPYSLNSTNYFFYTLYYDYFGAIFKIFNLIILPFIILVVIPFKLFQLWLDKYISNNKVEEAHSKWTHRLSKVNTYLKSRKKFTFAIILLAIPYILLMMTPLYQKTTRFLEPNDNFYVNIGLSGDKYKNNITYKSTPTITPTNSPVPTPTIAPYPLVTPVPFSYRLWSEYLYLSGEALPDEMKKYEQVNLHGLSYYSGADVSPDQLKYNNYISEYEKKVIYQLFQLEKMEKYIAYSIYDIEDSDNKLLFFSTFTDEGKIGVHFIDKNENIKKIASRIQPTGPYYVCGPDLYGKDNYIYIICTIGDGGGAKPFWIYKVNVTTGEISMLRYCSIDEEKTECEDL